MSLFSIRKNSLCAFLIFLTVPLFAHGDEPVRIETIAGTGESARSPESGPALEVPIGNPFGVEIGPEGALYICEVDFHRVRRLDMQSGQLTTVAGTGEKGYAGDGGPATEALLNEPYEVRFDAAGNMYFVEMRNNIVRKVNAKTGVISTVAGSGEAGYGGDGGPALEAKLRDPHSIALDDRGKLYIADIGNHRIRVVDLQTGTIDSLAGNGQKQLPIDGEIVRGKPMLGPRALAIQDRTMWIALREGHSIWKLDLDNEVITHVAGTGKKGYTGDGAPPLKATFNGPKGIALTSTGGVVVVDTENQVLRMIDPKENRISTLVGRGPDYRGPEGDGGAANLASLNRPHGVCVGPDDAVYIGDSENHRVRRAH
ncbi:MAG: hypothetical protein CMJ46_00905 [Planctomyces sp.]|nr:hypothetical protein [Planctomyces sp.]